MLSFDQIRKRATTGRCDDMGDAVKLIDQFKGPRGSFAAQFVKYAIAGGVATAVQIGVFYLCAMTILPALGENDWVVKLFGLAPAQLTDAQRATNASYGNLIGFIVSNAVCYVINILWVFKRGRHGWLIEVGLFYLVSGLSVGAGTAIMNWLIRVYGIQTTIAFGANLVTAVMFNFAMRKFVIFKG